MSTSFVLKDVVRDDSGNDAGFGVSGIAGGDDARSWSNLEKISVRFAVIFFVLALFPPLTLTFWRELFHSHLGHFQDLFRLTVIVPQYLSAPKWGFASFENLYLISIVAIGGAVAWGYLEKNSRLDYSKIYYWLRVFLRYRIAIGLIAYGLLQLFPIQFPKATLSDMHTNYGDLLQWKLYYITNGIAHAHYEEFLGGLEVLGGALLLWRSTATFGAIISASLLFNIVLANFAYQLGDHVYALLLLVAVSFLLLYDAGRLIDLLVLQRKARAERFRPDFSSPKAKRFHLIGKSVVAAFLLH